MTYMAQIPCRSCEDGDGLGLIPGASIVSSAVADIPVVGDIIGGIFGGRKKYTRCPQQGEIEAALQRAPRELVQELAQARARFVRDQKPAPANPSGIAFSAVGGSDCQITSPGGRDYFNHVTQKINEWISSEAEARSDRGAGAPMPAGVPGGLLAAAAVGIPLLLVLMKR